MRPHSRWLFTAFLPIASFFAPATSNAAWPHSAAVNLPVGTAGLQNGNPTIVSDGAGGAIVAWYDFRTIDYDIYAQHILASGTVDPAWPANGRVVCNAASSQFDPVMLSDGAGGAIIAWYDIRNSLDFDVYAQHLLASGVVDPAWPANGRALCVQPGNQINVGLVSDGAGGAIVTWEDARAGNSDVYAQRVLASGAVDPAWPLNGRAISVAANNQTVPQIVPDGAGGAIVAWEDARSPGDDIWAHHVLASGTLDPSWPADGRILCAAVSNQYSPTAASDGAGGTFVTWYDMRSGIADIYIHHVLNNGTLDPGIPGDGRLLCGAASYQQYPIIIGDGSGGAIVTWYDGRSGSNSDVYAHHFLATGIPDPSWPVDGRALVTLTTNQMNPRLVSDGAGGAIVTWEDYRSGTADMYAHHVLASGAADPTWPVDGRAVCTAAGGQGYQRIAPDGVGGAIISWFDSRSGIAHIYAQRVAPFGQLGTPEPVIASVKDVANDQGGKVKVSFDASWLDYETPHLVDHYWVFRSAAASAARAALAHGARLIADGDPTPARGERAFVARESATATEYWEYMGAVDAIQQIVQGYSTLVATTGDSTGSYNPLSRFMVMALDATDVQAWASASASGYSVDNVAPAPPAPFTGNYSGGATHLHWNPNVEGDLAGYRLYRGTSSGFVPGPGNLVAAPPDTGYADAGAAGGFYKISAIDIHGNESGFTLLTPANTSGVNGAWSGGEVALWLAGPNPSSGSTALRFALPVAGAAKLAIYDASGRRVRLIASGERPAGVYDETWDGRDAAGHPVSSGLFFARLEALGRVVETRIARVH